MRWGTCVAANPANKNSCCRRAHLIPGLVIAVRSCALSGAYRRGPGPHGPRYDYRNGSEAGSGVSPRFHRRPAPENQLADLEQLAGQRGYQIVQRYTDYISGVKGKRPGLDQLPHDAARHRFDSADEYEVSCSVMPPSYRAPIMPRT